MSGPSNPEKVVEVLRADRSRSLCDDCVALLAEIKNRVAVNPITTALGLTSDFEREKATCSRCREIKLVTRAVR
jgi:hypothetical protein